MNVLVDASVWIQLLNSGHDSLTTLLQTGRVLLHPFSIGELSMGTFKHRTKFLSDLKILPQAEVVSHQECLDFIENKKLYGLGLSYIDVHLLASAKVHPAQLLTLDRGLISAAKKLQLELYECK